MQSVASEAAAAGASVLNLIGDVLDIKDAQFLEEGPGRVEARQLALGAHYRNDRRRTANLHSTTSINDRYKFTGVHYRLFSLSLSLSLFSFSLLLLGLQ